jgi:predicted phosphodiesterase
MGRTPISRKDNFPETQFGKMEQIVRIYDREKCDFIFQAGDFFDSSTPSYRLINKYIDYFKQDGMYLYCVLGQHDMYMWNPESIDRTALGLMEVSDVLTIIRREKKFLGGYNDKHRFIVINGCSWGQEIPKAPKTDSYKILVIHANIFEKQLFKGHDIITPRRFIRKNPGWDFILCGDCHFPFEYTMDGTTMINTGIICRKSIVEKDIKPSVVILDTNTGKHKWIELEHEDDVFIERGESIGKTMFDDTNMLELLSGLRN